MISRKGGFKSGGTVAVKAMRKSGGVGGGEYKSIISFNQCQETFTSPVVVLVFFNRADFSHSVIKGGDETMNNKTPSAQMAQICC